MKFPAFDRNVALASWPDCVKMSKSFLLSGHLTNCSLATLTLILACPRSSHLDYKRWSCASENFLLSKCETEVIDRKKFLGRGSETSFRLKPVVQRVSPGDEHFADQECHFWSRLLSRLKFLALRR